MRFIFFLVRRLLFFRKSFRSLSVLISTAGIFLVTLLITVSLGILFGYQRVYYDAVTSFSSHIMLTREGGVPETEQAQVSQTLARIGQKFPLFFSPYQYHETLFPTGEGLRALIFKGVDFERLKEVYPLRVSFFAAEETTDPAVLVGADIIARQPKILKDQRIKFILMDQRGRSPQVSFSFLPVQGSFESGYYDFDSRFVLMPLSMMDLFFDHKGVAGFEIRVSDMQDIPLIVNALHAELDPYYQIVTWDELNRDLFEALRLDRTVVLSVSFLIVMIACLNIFGFNFLFFAERKREFAILSVLGMGKSGIKRLLVLASLFLGGMAVLAGGVVGLMILYFLDNPGIRLDPRVYYVDRIPVRFDGVWFLFFILGTMGLCLVTSFVARSVVMRQDVVRNI